MPKKPTVHATIWISHPHDLQGGQLARESIEQAIQETYYVPIRYQESARYGYDAIQILEGIALYKIHEIGRALLFLHRKWIAEDRRLHWNGEVIVSVTEHEDRPDWVKKLDQEWDARFQERMR